MKCLSNMKQQGIALLMYAQDYDEKFPANPASWMDLSLPYLKNWAAYHCPSLKASEFGYAFNTVVAEKTPQSLVTPGQVLLLLESTNRKKNASTAGKGASSRHDGWGSLMYADGHAQSIRHKEHTTPVSVKL